MKNIIRNLSKNLSRFFVGLACVGLFTSSLSALTIISDSDREHIQPAVDLWNKTHKDKIKIKYIDEDVPLTLVVKYSKPGRTYDLVISENLDIVVALSYYGYLKPEPEIAKFIESKDFINKNNLIDPKNRWFAYTYRIRAFYVKKGSKLEPKTYKELADKKYYKKICIRSFANHYNIDLFINLRNIWSYNNFMTWFNNFSKNIKYKPKGNDRYQVKLVSEGKCEVAVANSHYRGAMLENPTQKEWAEKTKVIIPEPAVAMYSSVGVLKGSKDPNALKFIKFLYSEKAQKAISNEAYVFALKENWTTKFTREILKENGISQKDIKIVSNPKNKLFTLRPWAYKLSSN